MVNQSNTEEEGKEAETFFDRRQGNVKVSVVRSEDDHNIARTETPRGRTRRKGK